MKIESDLDMDKLIAEHRRLVIQKERLDLVMNVLSFTWLVCVSFLVLGLLLKAKGTWQAAVGIPVTTIGIGLIWPRVTNTANMLQRLEDEMKRVCFI